MPDVVLDFGIEVEFLLKPTSRDLKGFMCSHGYYEERNGSEEDKKANRLAFRKALADILKEEVKEHIDEGSYDTWVVADEPTLDEQPGYWRCEIVSRILKSDQEWQKEINDVFRILHDNCDVLLTSGCSMHVHISPSSNRYNVSQLRKIIKGIIYYDRPLTTILPRGRKHNLWAASNVKATPAWNDAVNGVSQNTWTPLFDFFDEKTMIQTLLLDLCDDRYVAWNFSNVLKRCGTVEFRRPPGVSSSAEANHWTAVTLGYVVNALMLQDWNIAKLKTAHPSTNDLRNAITRGAQALGPSTVSGLRSALMADVNEDPEIFSLMELLRIEQRKKDKER